MVIQKPAVAGTVESSDALVSVEPGDGKIELTLTSSVMNQYGRQIKETVLETLARLGVDNVRISVVDKGALDCTLKARVECAVFRSSDASEKDIPWGTPDAGYKDSGSWDEYSAHYFNDRTILIIDDAFTTGSTCFDFSDLLMFQVLTRV